MTDEESRYQRYQAAYCAAEPPPWDSGIVPPEVRALVEGGNRLPPGRALDVGCGTGVSAVYLAAHGWQVTGVDWIEEALARARLRARESGLAAGQVRFLRANVVSPDFLPDHPPVSLWLDVGCMHTFPADELLLYARHASRLVVPGGTLKLYAWRRHERDGAVTGLEPEAVRALLAPAFTLVEAALSQDTADGVRPSAWYTLRRLPGVPSVGF